MASPLPINLNPNLTSLPSSASDLPPNLTRLYHLVSDLRNPDLRETTLSELSKNRDLWPVDHFAPILWHSFGTIAILLQEILAVYPLISPSNNSATTAVMFTPHASNRVCNALALLQKIASFNETRHYFLAAQIPLYLYPFLNTFSGSGATGESTTGNKIVMTKQFEYLRLTSLGVIGALVKTDNQDGGFDNYNKFGQGAPGTTSNSEVVSFLLKTELIPICLRIMETNYVISNGNDLAGANGVSESSDLSRTVATFILQRIILDNAGLEYVCSSLSRFHAVVSVLSSLVTYNLVPMVKTLNSASAYAEGQEKVKEKKVLIARLLMYCVRIYLRLTDNPKAREFLRKQRPASQTGISEGIALSLRDNLVPESFRDGTFDEIISSGGEMLEQNGTKQSLKRLVAILNSSDK